MATTTIAGETAVTIGNFTGAALLETEDVNGDSRKITAAQVRTKMFAGGTGFTASDPLVAGTGTFSGTVIVSQTSLGSVRLGDASFADGVANVYGNAETQNILALKSSAAYSTNGGKVVFIKNSADAVVFTIAGNGDVTLGNSVELKGVYSGVAYSLVKTDNAGNAYYGSSGLSFFIQSPNLPNAATQYLVTAGVSDSGGSGKRLLLIPN